MEQYNKYTVYAGELNSRCMQPEEKKRKKKEKEKERKKMQEGIKCTYRRKSLSHRRISIIFSYFLLFLYFSFIHFFPFILIRLVLELYKINPLF